MATSALLGPEGLATYAQDTWVRIQTPDSVLTWDVGLQLLVGLPDGEEALVIASKSYLAEYRRRILDDARLDAGQIQYEPGSSWTWIRMGRGRAVKLVVPSALLMKGCHPTLVIVDDVLLAPDAQAELPRWLTKPCTKIVLS